MFSFDNSLYHHTGIKDDNVSNYINYLDRYVLKLKNTIITNCNNEGMYKYLKNTDLIKNVIDNIANITYRLESINIKICQNINNFNNADNGSLYNKMYKDNMEVKQPPSIILNNKVFCKIMGNIIDCLIIVHSSPYMNNPDYVYGSNKTETLFSRLKYLYGYSFDNPPLREAINYITNHYMDRLVAYISLKN